MADLTDLLNAMNSEEDSAPGVNISQKGQFAEPDYASPMPLPKDPREGRSGFGGFLLNFLDNINEQQAKDRGEAATEDSKRRILEYQNALEFNSKVQLHNMALHEAFQNTQGQIEAQKQATKRKADILRNFAAQEKDPERANWLKNAAQEVEAGFNMGDVLKRQPTKASSAEITQQRKEHDSQILSKAITAVDTAAQSGEDLNDPKVKTRLFLGLKGMYDQAQARLVIDDMIKQATPKGSNKAPDTIKAQMNQYKTLQTQMKMQIAKIMTNQTMDDETKRQSALDVQSQYMPQLNTLASSVNDWHEENNLDAPLNTYDTAEEVLPPSWWQKVWGSKGTVVPKVVEKSPGTQGKTPKQPSGQPSAKPTKPMQMPQEEKVISGVTYVKKNGKWFKK